MQASRAATALVRRAGAVAVAAVAPTRAAGAMCCRAFSAVVSPFEAPDADFVVRGGCWGCCSSVVVAVLM